MAIDDIVAALLLLFVMMRRLEIKSIAHKQHAGVSAEQIEAWKERALGACHLAAAACALKVLVSLGWYALALRLNVGEPWFRLLPMLAFGVWVVALIVAYRQAAQARQLSYDLGLNNPSPGKL